MEVKFIWMSFLLQQGVIGIVAQCEPGSYSASGREPCIICNQGFYTTIMGATTCDKCPNETPRTLTRGSTEESFCLDLRLEEGITVVQFDLETHTNPRVFVERTASDSLAIFKCNIELIHNIMLSETIGKTFEILWVVSSFDLVVGSIQCTMNPDISFNCEIGSASIKPVLISGDIPGEFHLQLDGPMDFNSYANDTLVCQALIPATVGPPLLLSESSTHLVVLEDNLTMLQPRNIGPGSGFGFLDTLEPGSNFIVTDGQIQRVICQITTISRVDDLIVWSINNREMSANTSYSFVAKEDQSGSTNIGGDLNVLYVYTYTFEWIPNIGQRDADLQCRLKGIASTNEVTEVTVSLAVVGINRGSFRIEPSSFVNNIESQVTCTAQGAYSLFVNQAQYLTWYITNGSTADHIPLLTGVVESTSNSNNVSRRYFNVESVLTRTFLQTDHGEQLICEIYLNEFFNATTVNTIDILAPTTSPDASKKSLTQTQVIIIVSAFVFLLIVIVLLIVLITVKWCRRNKGALDKNNFTESGKENSKKEVELETRRISEFNDYGVTKSSGKPKERQVSYMNVKSDKRNFNFPPRKLNVKKELGRGQFGVVLLAEADGILKKKRVDLVAVKTLKENAGKEEMEELRRELDLMKKFNQHSNVVHLLGSSVNKDNLMIIVEYMAKGNLKDFLLENRSSIYEDVHSAGSLTPRQLVMFACQIAKGMDYVSQLECIHRDLAARNVLINDELVCKVSDFGLGRDVQNVRIYERTSSTPLPIRWMSLESLHDDVFSTKSDVWSYGILLWEIVTLGAKPYPAMSTKSVIDGIREGYRMPQPKHCRDEIYSLMLSCWNEKPAERPNFQDLCAKLEAMLEEESDYLTFEIDDDLYDDVAIVLEEGEKI